MDGAGLSECRGDGTGQLLAAKGSTLVSVATLSVFNELHVPVGLIINMLLWGNDVPVLRLIAGCCLIAIAIGINYRHPSRSPQRPAQQEATN